VTDRRDGRVALLVRAHAGRAYPASDVCGSTPRDTGSADLRDARRRDRFRHEAIVPCLIGCCIALDELQQRRALASRAPLAHESGRVGTSDSYVPWATRRSGVRAAWAIALGGERPRGRATLAEIVRRAGHSWLRWRASKSAFTSWVPRALAEQERQVAEVRGRGATLLAAGAVIASLLAKPVFDGEHPHGFAEISATAIGLLGSAGILVFVWFCCCARTSSGSASRRG
jgi:hypothetical protein